MKMNLWFEPSRAQFDKRKYFVNFIYLYIYIYTLVSKEISRYFKTILLKIINSKLIHRVSDPLYRIDNSPRNYYTPWFIYYIYRLICYPIYRAKWKWILYAIKYFSRRKHHFIRNICLFIEGEVNRDFFFFKNQLFLFLGLFENFNSNKFRDEIRVKSLIEKLLEGEGFDYFIPRFNYAR